MKRKVIDLIFVLGFLLFLLGSLGRTLLRPKDINYYENRYANRVAAFSVSGWLDGSFQDGMESGLSDQLLGAQRLEKAYHQGFSRYQRMIAERLTALLPDRYLNIGQMRMFNGYLCYYARPAYMSSDALARRVENYNAIFAAEPDTDFYLYYVEKETDLDLETGEKTAQAYEQLQPFLTLPASRTGCFRVNDFSEYSNCYYRTDHHWNFRGAYRGYCEILSMLAPEETPLVPGEPVCVGSFAGSKAEGKARSAFSEDFYAFPFEFPAMEVTINGAPAADYGNQDAFFAGEAWGLNYGSFYGGDDAFIHFHNADRADAGSLLVIGDSFDNAILKLLASHFGDTYAVDLRYAAVQSGEAFRLGSFLEENDISKVLLVGNIDYYVSDAFLLED